MTPPAEAAGRRPSRLRRLSGVLVAGAALVVQVAPVPAATSRSEVLDGRIAEAIASVASAHPQLVGLSVGLVHGGASYVHHYGTTERGRLRPPTSRTIYAIASITKTFTGTLLAQAAVAGNVRLDDDVRKHLDGEFPGLQFQGQPVRLFHLLNHRSGLPTDLAPPGAASDPASLYDRLREVVLTTPPGREFHYSNAAAQLLGRVLERVGGASYEQLVHRRIAAPLGMQDTSLILTPAGHTRLATGYDESGRAVSDDTARLQAAGGLKSSLADMLAYARWHMEERDAAVRLSHQPTFVEGHYSVGLNWQILTADGRRVLWQEGTVPGYTSYCIVEPELRLALVVLANESDPGSSRALATLANAVLSAADRRAVPLP